MFANMSSVVLVSLTFALQTVPPPGGAAPKPQPQAATSLKPGTLAMAVTSEKGDMLTNATVAVRGATDRSGSTGMDGVALLQNIPAGTYRVRITRDGFITLEKEVTIRAGARLTSEAVLSAAPPPPPPPPPPAPAPVEPKTTMSALKPGMPKVASLTDLVEQMLKDPQPIVEREIGCSGATTSRLILVRDSLAPHRHADADEVIYLMAGEATLTLDQKEQVIGPGWFGLVPRGISHSLLHRGRNPAVVLSVQSGQPCVANQK